MKPISKMLGIAALALPATMTTASAADSQTTSIELTAEAKQVCHMPAPVNSSVNNASFDGNKITIAQLLDDQTARVKASEVTVTYPQVLCNWAATVTMASTNGKMMRTAGTDNTVSGSGEFLDHVDYKARLNWGSVSIDNFDTSSLPADKKLVKQTSGANVADMVVTVATNPGTVPVLAGTYTDTLTIKVGAAY